MKTQQTLKAFASGDGAHCGLGDWYPEKEKALELALKSGKPFDTGWYSSKKEIASARISSDDGFIVKVEVSVSDDFDTTGMGNAIVPSKNLEDVRTTIYKAWDEAEGDQKDNREYRGYSIIHYSTTIPEWRKRDNVCPIEKRKRYGRKQPQCVDTYIANCSGWGADSPPGDNYHFWGWQSDPMLDHPTFKGALIDKPDQGQNPDPELGIPTKVKEAFEDHAQSLKQSAIRIGDWEIKPWDKEEE
jgi:hypothetical protein